MSDSDNDVTPVPVPRAERLMACTDSRSEVEPTTVIEAEPPSYRIVTGFGVVFARDLPWPNRALPEAEWDKIRDDLALHGNVEVFEYLPPTEYEDDPEGPFLAVAVTGSIIEAENLTGVIRDLPKYEGSWPTFIQAALDVLRASNPVLASFINEEPSENLRPSRFILVEEDDDTESGE